MIRRLLARRAERERARLVERGRWLASVREDLIVRGVDPLDLVMPVFPEPRLPDPGRGRES